MPPHMPLPLVQPLNVDITHATAFHTISDAVSAPTSKCARRSPPQCSSSSSSRTSPWPCCLLPRPPALRAPSRSPWTLCSPSRGPRPIESAHPPAAAASSPCCRRCCTPGHRGGALPFQAVLSTVCREDQGAGKGDVVLSCQNLEQLATPASPTPGHLPTLLIVLFFFLMDRLV